MPRRDATIVCLPDNVAALGGGAWMNLFFWLLLNLAVPIAKPIFTLALVAPA
ncbi:hypothetical protein [Paraburkholderia sp. CI3]|uniref:hypothetical protein n=1 Tax=Paraburkholderia sp. CI3 TaxID=2991060 RepID=UPI003D23751B